jgi:apolipoprotein N-acyltransferase
MFRFPKIACLFLGLASATGFVPLGWWFVTLFAFALMMVIVERAESVRAALGRGYWFGVGHFVLSMNWIAGSFRYQETMPVWIGWVAVVGLAFYLALFPAVAAGAAWKFARRHLPFILLFAAFWIITEYLRGTLFTGYAWNPLGMVAMDTGLQTAAPVVGTYGLSGLVVIGAGALTLFFMKRNGSALILASAVCGIALFGQITMPPQSEGKGPLVRIVQPNISQQDKHDSTFEAVNFAKLEKLTGGATKNPRLILWPEAAIPEFIEEEDWARLRIASLLGPRDLLLTGGDQLIYNKADKLVGAHNSLFAVKPDAKIIGRYDKSHLVPGGEYLPLRWLMAPLGATRLVPGDIDFIQGPGPRTLTLPGFGKAGVQICYEIIFSGEVVDRANRPDFLFNPSNDAWFGAWGPPQFLAQARMRGIEEGLPVLRSTPTGVTAVIDAEGRILKSLPPLKPGFIETRLPASHAPTLFARFGNILPFGFAAFLTLLGIALRRYLR